MAHYSIHWLGAAGAPDDFECSTSSKVSVKRKARNMAHKLFLGKHPQEWRDMLDWIDAIDPHPPKTYATVVTFEKILPGIGRFFIYCYKGDGRR